MVCVPFIDPNCHPLEQAAADIAKDFLGSLAKAAADAATETLRVVVTGWLNISPGQVGDPNTSQAFGTVAHLQDATRWIVAALAVFGVLYKALRMALDQNGWHGWRMTRSLLILVVVTGAGIATIQILIDIGDGYSSWIIGKSLGVDPSSNVLSPFEKKLVLFSPVGIAAVANPLILIGISLFLISITFAQLLMMYGRTAGLILMAGLMPVAAAAGISGHAGKQMRHRYFVWLLSFVLYKPAAATVYAAAFWAIGDAHDLNSLLTGIVMFFMALVALPALMRIISPAVGILAADNEGGGEQSGVNSSTVVATGAIRMGMGGGGGAGAGAGASGAAAAGGGAAAALPAVAAVIAAGEVAKAGPKVVRKVGGTAAKGVGGDRVSPPSWD